MRTESNSHAIEAALPLIAVIHTVRCEGSGSSLALLDPLVSAREVPGQQALFHPRHVDIDPGRATRPSQYLGSLVYITVFPGARSLLESNMHTFAMRSSLLSSGNKEPAKGWSHCGQDKLGGGVNRPDAHSRTEIGDEPEYASSEKGSQMSEGGARP